MGRKPSKPKDSACAAAEIMAAKSGLNARAELGQPLRLQARRAPALVEGDFTQPP